MTGTPLTPAVPEWSDFEASTVREAVGVALIECGLYDEKDDDPPTAVRIDWWLTDALIEALNNRGWLVTRLANPAAAEPQP